MSDLQLRDAKEQTTAEPWRESLNDWVPEAAFGTTEDSTEPVAWPSHLDFHGVHQVPAATLDTAGAFSSTVGSGLIPIPFPDYLTSLLLARLLPGPDLSRPIPDELRALVSKVTRKTGAVSREEAEKWAREIWSDVGHLTD